jgi:predicted ATPase
MDKTMAVLAPLPILVIGAGRLEVEDRFPGLFRTRSPEYLRLRPLSRKQGEALIRHHLPAAEKSFFNFVLDRWNGNPKFLEEMCLSAANNTIEVPEVVQATVEGRFDGLDPDARRLLRAASIFGDKPVSSAAMIALLGEPARKGISEWFEILVMRNLFEREIQTGEALYRFRDKLVREAAYRTLNPKDRVVARRLARAFLEGEGHTLPETLTAPLSQTSKLVANT